MSYLQICKSIFILFSFAALVSCGSSNGSGSSSESGRVSILVTDGPSTEFDQINITLESISFISDDEDDDEFEDSDDDVDNDDDANETIVFDEVKVINLLALQNYSDLLTTTLIPVGTYSKIRLHVSQVELVKLNPDGTVLSSVLAKLPANGKIDLNPRGSFDVVSDEHLMIELDIDANKSIHIVQTGNGKYIFRPVIFVNVLGQEELKLVIMDGKVLANSESGFYLCDIEDVVINENCIEVYVSENTVVQDNLINVVASSELLDNDIVTVLGKAGGEKIYALHVVIADDNNEHGLFSGISDSAVGIDNIFDMTTDDDSDLISAASALSVAIADGARIYNEHGAELAVNSIGVGTDVDVFGLAAADLSSVPGVKAAFLIVSNELEDDNISGAIVAINTAEQEITITVVSESFSGDVCIDVDDADLFLLELVGGNVSSQEITIDELKLGMSADIYGEDDDDDACMSADVVLVTEG